MNPPITKQLAEIIEAHSDAGAGYCELTPAQTHYIAEPGMGRVEVYLEQGLTPWLEQQAWLADVKERAELFAEILQSDVDRECGHSLALTLQGIATRSGVPPYLQCELANLKVMRG